MELETWQNPFHITSLLGRSFCPITRLVYELNHGLFKPMEYWNAAAELGLTWEDAFNIVEAADGLSCKLTIKEKLLEACHITLTN